MEVHPGFLSQWRPLRLSPTPCHDHTMITPTSPEQMLPQNPQDKAAFVSPAASKPTNTTRTTSTSPHRCASQNLPDASRTGTAAAVLPRLTFGSIRPLSRVWGADSYRELEAFLCCSGPWGRWGFHRYINIQSALPVSCFLIFFLPIF